MVSDGSTVLLSRLGQEGKLLGDEGYASAFALQAAADQQGGFLFLKENTPLPQIYFFKNHSIDQAELIFQGKENRYSTTPGRRAVGTEQKAACPHRVIMRQTLDLPGGKNAALLQLRAQQGHNVGAGVYSQDGILQGILLYRCEIADFLAG